MNRYFLQPGEIFFSDSPTEITTILGSCVAVCIYDRENRYGGMCHYYLPYTNKQDEQLPNKYGEFAIINLLKEFKQRGSFVEDLEAKVVGGGHVLESMEKRDDGIGDENARIAQKILKQFNIPIVANKTGGDNGIKVRFISNTNALFLQQIQKTSSAKPIKISPLKVLLIDPNIAETMQLQKMINDDARLEVVAVSVSIQDAIKMMNERKPDVVLLDLALPPLGGEIFFEQKIKPLGITTILMSKESTLESAMLLRGLEAGIFSSIKKPDSKDYLLVKDEIIQTIHTAATSKGKMAIVRSSEHVTPELIKERMDKFLIVIGASTGGTEAVKELLTKLPKVIPPMVIVQHIPPVFSAAYAGRLNTLCNFPVEEVRNSAEVHISHAYLAMGGIQMGFKKKNSTALYLECKDDPPVNRFKPSVDYLYNSLDGSLHGRKVIAVLLTGMGDDGARGLLRLKKLGAYTITQDESTSVVYGMPKAAKEMGASTKVLPLHEIAFEIISYISKH